MCDQCVLYIAGDHYCKNWLRRPNKPLYINPCFIKRCCSPIYHICWGTNWSACIYANGLPDAQLFGSVMFIVIWVAEMDVSSRNAILFNCLLILIYFLLALLMLFWTMWRLLSWSCSPSLGLNATIYSLERQQNKTKTKKKRRKKRQHWCELATKSK